MDLELFGIATCDTCRRARKWLRDHAIAHRFVDLRKDKVERQTIARWLDAVGADRLVNRRSTTWRNLPPARRELSSTGDALALLAEHPTLIKRPVIAFGETLLVGFDEDVRTRLSAGDLT